jgi:hypothetical protein
MLAPMLDALQRHSTSRSKARIVLLVVLPATGLGSAGCSIGCDDLLCCRSCTDESPRRACRCDDDETAAQLCPKRSACALALYVGDRPATCCPDSCTATEIYTEDQGRCAAEDRYLHECTIESACYQTYLATRLGTTFVPWREEASGSGALLSGIWAATPDDVWAVGLNGTILHREAGGWTSFESPTSENLQTVWGAAPR